MGNQVPKNDPQRAVVRCKTVSFPRDNSSPQHSAEPRFPKTPIRPQRVLPLQRNVLLDTDRRTRGIDSLHGVKKSGTAKKRTSSLLYSKFVLCERRFFYTFFPFTAALCKSLLLCITQRKERKKHMNGYQKYQNSIFRQTSKPRMDEKDSIDKAPIWCSVDLRDGQPSPHRPDEP